MTRFEPKNSFGWTLFVLIFATFWSGATIKNDASPSSAPAVSSRSISESSSSAFDAPAETLESNRDARRCDFLRFVAGASEPQTAFFETFRRDDGRRLQDSTRRRFGGDFSTVGGSTKSFSARLFVLAEFGSAAFRSFWACQSASRPLFLVLRSLRN